MVARRPCGEIRAYPAGAQPSRATDSRVVGDSRAPAAPRSPPRPTRSRAASPNGLALEGILAVEMFLLANGTLLVNELAPRPHNSYHETEVACATSQFEQIVRAVCDLPLGDPTVLRPGAIFNLFGELWEHGAPPFESALVEARSAAPPVRQARRARRPQDGTSVRRWQQSGRRARARPRRRRRRGRWCVMLTLPLAVRSPCVPSSLSCAVVIARCGVQPASRADHWRRRSASAGRPRRSCVRHRIVRQLSHGHGDDSRRSPACASARSRSPTATPVVIVTGSVDGPRARRARHSHSRIRQVRTAVHERGQPLQPREAQARVQERRRAAPRRSAEHRRAAVGQAAVRVLVAGRHAARRPARLLGRATARRSSFMRRATITSPIPPAIPARAWPAA